MPEGDKTPMERFLARANVGEGFSQNSSLAMALRRRADSRSMGSDVGSGSGSGAGNQDVKPDPSKGESSNSSSSPDAGRHPDPGGGNGGGDGVLYRGLAYGWVSVVGRRRDMEDTLAVAQSFTDGYDFYGVYDGHGGPAVANLCKDRMHVVLAEELGGAEQENWDLAMTNSFARVDAEATDGEENRRNETSMVGSTAVVAVVGPNRIVVANCGDSRAVISRGGVAIPLSVDHKPERPDELARVEAAGGTVVHWHGYRIFGVLATSRAIGDFCLKPYVIAEPEVMVVDRTYKDEFLILASDGLWDVVSSEKACRVVRRYLSGRSARVAPPAGRVQRRHTVTEAATLLVEIALSHGSGDNITVVVVELKKLDVRRGSVIVLPKVKPPSPTLPSSIEPETGNHKAKQGPWGEVAQEEASTGRRF
ncbi:hypothetical protein J5N97_019675 [Dioscorea zingiberensis]|uniref:protein-serine/threonine phosphatase n=1 Tax=Dioscorea zingiberensis TaxID=325984 RepID=A0A9D5HCI4_9LILI|nr:hypothetical protein J5N97_019675 [Dioscorea zingiberensis]